MDMPQPLGPTTAECLNRARADLRMGLPVVLSGAALAVAVETLSPARLAAMAAMGPLTLARRAETLKARAYDGDLARVDVPAGADLRWLHALADPADDLRVPMKGPLATRREGPADLERAALALMKSAQLLPAALLVPLSAPPPEGLTALAAPDVLTMLASETQFGPVAAARVPLRAAEQGRLHVFRPDDGGEEHYAIEIGATATVGNTLPKITAAQLAPRLYGYRHSQMMHPHSFPFTSGEVSLALVWITDEEMREEVRMRTQFLETSPAMDMRSTVDSFNGALMAAE